MHEIATALKEYRRKAGLTQAELARLAGLSLATVAHLESSRFPSKPSSDTLRRLRRVMARDTVLPLVTEAGAVDTSLAGSLRALRLDLGFSQESLAKRAHCSTVTISHLEAPLQKGEPTMRTLKAVARALGCELVCYFRKRSD